MTKSYVCYHCGAQYDERVEFCLGCSRFRGVHPRMSRPVESLWQSHSRIKSAADMIREKSVTRRSQAYPDITFGPSALIGCYGQPGGGKSTMATQWLDGIAGPVLYLSAEEGLGDTMASRLRRLEVVRDDFYGIEVRSFEELDGLLTRTESLALVIDSVNVMTLQPADLLHLVQDRGIVCWFVLQSTKDGGFAGVQSWGHVADVMIRVEGLRWKMEKSRYSSLTEGSVLCQH